MFFLKGFGCCVSKTGNCERETEQSEEREMNGRVGWFGEEYWNQKGEKTGLFSGNRKWFTKLRRDHGDSREPLDIYLMRK